MTLLGPWVCCDPKLKIAFFDFNKRIFVLHLVANNKGRITPSADLLGENTSFGKGLFPKGTLASSDFAVRVKFTSSFIVFFSTSSRRIQIMEAILRWVSGLVRAGGSDNGTDPDRILRIAVRATSTELELSLCLLCTGGSARCLVSRACCRLASHTKPATKSQSR